MEGKTVKKKMKVAAVVAVFAVTVCFSWQICSITTSAAETERAAGESVHSYRHTEKYRFDEDGNPINEAVFGDSDEATYPFLYKSYISTGSEFGQPSSQRLPIKLMTSYLSLIHI